MKMEMEQYWPQHKVFLFGQCAFLPDDLENKALTKEKLRHYFPAENVEELEAALNKYQQEGYFKIKIIADAGEPKQYIIANSDHAKFHDELVAYLEEIKAKLPTEQREMPWSVAAKQYRERGYRPVIRWRDIYGDSTRVNYTPPFWEIIFIPVMLDRIKLINISHDKVFPYLRSNSGYEKMPEAMLPYFTRPRAEFEVLDKVLRQRIAKPRSTPNKYKATLSLRGKNLWLVIGKKRFIIWKYKSKADNSYRAFYSLYEKPKLPLKRNELNLKPNSKTLLKHLPNNMGFTGVLLRLFMESASQPASILLHRSIDVEDEDYEPLLAEAEKRNKHFAE
jgi:hypothetical protein